MSKREDQQTEWLKNKDAEIHRLAGEVYRLRLQVEKLKAENAALRKAYYQTNEGKVAS